ncbi:MAG TPA: hypothetical protein VFE62_15015 [Gemmataceae bacterium]|nr:hypothetical protein [Gemmataceae bacterium]
MSYNDDDDDDFEIGRPRRRPRDRDRDERPTLAGIYGFIAALISLGLLAIVVVLYIFLQHGQNNPDVNRLISWWFLLLDTISFFAGLLATILGTRGAAPTNPLHRGYAVTAIVLGILEMVVTVVFGLIMTCVVLVIEAMHAAPPPGG